MIFKPGQPKRELTDLQVLFNVVLEKLFYLRISTTIAEVGTTADVIKLLPPNRETITGSRMPSISTDGAAIKAMMKQVVAASRVGNISTPNQPT